MNAGTFYAVSIDGKLSTNCQKDPLVYFRRRDAITHAERECVRDCVAVMKPRKIKIVRVRIEVEK